MYTVVINVLLTVSTKEDTMLHSLQLSFHRGAEVASKINEPLHSLSASGQGHTAFVTIEC